MPQLSVIIPTFCRKATLLRVLDGLSRQRGLDPQEFEIVVADDGSPDGTAEAVGRWAATAPVRLVFSPSAENRGPAHARNRAMSLANGRVLLMTGDDILPEGGLLARHVRWHASHPAAEDALLGRVTWPDEPPPTPFMRWLADAGSAFYFTYPASAGRVASDRFYTCNVSVKRALVERCGGFDEAFTRASHEDIEFGLRLSRQGGMRLHYDSEALAFHDHRLSFSAAFRRVYFMGYSSILFWSRVGERSSTARRACRRLLQIAASPELPRKAAVSLVGRAETVPCSPLWEALLSAAYWFGASDASRGRPALPPQPDNGGGK